MRRVPILATSLIVAAIALSVYAPEEQHAWSALVRQIATILASFGVALILFRVVERRAYQLLLKREADQIVQLINGRLAEIISQIDEAFDIRLQVLKQLRDHGLVAVHGARQVADAVGLGAVHDSIRTSTTCCVLGVSALDLFGPPRGALALAGPHYQLLERELARADRPLAVRAILLDPDSEAAQLREKVETVDGEPADIGGDHRTAVRGAMGLARRLKGDSSILLRLTKEMPPHYMILTDDHAFLEFYHAARTEKFCRELERHGREAASLSTNCNGGRIPVLQFAKNSSVYIALRLHFDAQWKAAEEVSIPTRSEPGEDGPVAA